MRSQQQPQQQYSWMDSYSGATAGSNYNNNAKKLSINNLNSPDTTTTAFYNNDTSGSTNPSRRAISTDSPQIPIMRRGGGGIDRESFQSGYRPSDFQQQQQQQNGYLQNTRTFSSYQQQQSRIIVTADEEFDKLVREQVDFRDVRYQEFQAQFEEEMREYDSNAIAFDGTSSPNNQNSKNPAQYLQLQSTQSAINTSSTYQQAASNSAAMLNYSQLQSKFYASRKRDQKDIQERYERMMRVVRDSHAVDVRNLVSKFKGLLQEKTDKVLEEQRLKYEQENKEMREGHYALKTQIRNLEKTIEGLNQKLTEKDRMLQESYNKISGINEQLGDKGKKRDQDIENLNKSLKAAEKTITDLNARDKDSNDRIFKLSSQLAGIKEDLIKKEGEIAGNSAILSQKAIQIKQLNNDLQSANNQLSAVLIQLKTAKEELAKLQTGAENKTPVNEKNLEKVSKPEKPAVKAIKQEEIVLKPPVTPAKNIPVLIANKEIKKQVDKQQQLKDTSKLKENTSNNNAPELLLLFKKNRRQEIQQVKAFVEVLTSQIKLKEDQIKLLQVEVLALREQTDTYSQTLQRLTLNTSHHRKNHSSTTPNNTAKSLIRSQAKQFSPSLNDLLLIEGADETRTLPNEQYGLVNDENTFISSVFSKGMFSPTRLKAQQQSQQFPATDNQLEKQSYSLQFPSSTEQRLEVADSGENNIGSSTNSVVKSRSNSIRRNLYAVTAEKTNSTRSSFKNNIKNNGIHINITYNSSISNNSNSDTFSKLLNFNTTNAPHHHQKANSVSANHFSRNGGDTVFQMPSLLNSSNSFESGSSFRATAFNFSTTSPHAKNSNSYTSTQQQQQKQQAALRKSTPSRQIINSNNSSSSKGAVSQQFQRQSSGERKLDGEESWQNNQGFQQWSPEQKYGSKSPSDSFQWNGGGDKDSSSNMIKSTSPKKQNKNNSIMNSSTLFIPLNI